MHIRSATFVKGVVGPDEVLADGHPQVAFVGRSNVGKSSTINALTRQKGLARHSSTPGLTKELNVYLINKAFYLVDLPGYGYSKSNKEQGNRQQDRIGWYLFQSAYTPRVVVLIIDAKVGATDTDAEMLAALEERGHPILIVANKVDRLGPNALKTQLRAIQERVGHHPVLPLAATKKTGIGKLGEMIEGYLRTDA